MRRPTIFGGILLLLTGGLGSGRVAAQAPTIDPGAAPSVPGAGRSLLGPAPGSGGGRLPGSPGAGEGILGGRPGVSTSRAPASTTQPGGGIAEPPERGGIGPPVELPVANLPLYGSLAEPGQEDQGPSEGLTLDVAIDLLLRNNLDLRSRFYEIPQARADVLTASLRANPVLYADAQLVPYGTYSKARPGGPVQYDFNITYPLDVTHKRQARTAVASQAVRVLEAQFQDAVRLQIDNLYTAYVDALAARATVQYARAGLEGLEAVLKVTQEQFESKNKTQADVDRIRIQRDAARINLLDAEAGFRRSQQVLATLLNLPSSAASSLEVRGSIRDSAPPAPTPEALKPLALGARPDLLSYRLGIRRAEADVRLARANRLSDVYLLYQPYTFQDNTPFGTKSATSWAVGLTIPLPIYNRNQGNIQRARLNVSQTQVELAALERQVVAEVEQAGQEYAVTREAVERLRSDLLPAARNVLNVAYLRYREGEEDVVTFLNARSAYNDVVRQYRDFSVRHRRSMLNLNTAVGRRILP
jgi:cobalt-zinc-cadmium efflux system outer membrane protein